MGSPVPTRPIGLRRVAQPSLRRPTSTFGFVPWGTARAADNRYAAASRAGDDFSFPPTTRLASGSRTRTRDAQSPRAFAPPDTAPPAVCNRRPAADGGRDAVSLAGRPWGLI